MDYVWTYWTKPSKEKPFFKKIFDIACLGLSTSLVKKHGVAKNIYTDNDGAKIIDQYSINVPYIVSLDHLKNEDPLKWALPKIDTYFKINFPCVHIDYDVFLWKKQKNTNSDFCCQSLENYGDYNAFYKNVYEKFKEKSDYIPEEILNYSAQNLFEAYNMGYFQINNINFLKKYAKESIKVFSHMKDLNSIDNIFPEQYLFYCMAKYNNIEVDTLIQDLKKADRDDSIFLENGYTHVMGSKFTDPKGTFEKVMNKLQTHNIDCYKAIRSTSI